MYMYLAQCLVVVQFIHVALSTANWFAKNVDQSYTYFDRQNNTAVEIIL